MKTAENLEVLVTEEVLRLIAVIPMKYLFEDNGMYFDIDKLEMINDHSNDYIVLLKRDGSDHIISKMLYDPSIYTLNILNEKIGEGVTVDAYLVHSKDDKEYGKMDVSKLDIKLYEIPNEYK